MQERSISDIMEINLFFSSSKSRSYWKRRAYAVYHYEGHKQELFTKRFRSTVKSLIHEDMHQVIHELEEGMASIEYDNIALELEKWLFR